MLNLSYGGAVMAGKSKVDTVDIQMVFYPLLAL